MSEYWKSTPKKFCDFCKCWFADNRASIEFHERGKKHQDNVRKKLEEIGKKGKEDYANKLKQDDYMKEMEEAALRAYKEDIEQNPDMMGVKVAEVASKNNAKIVVGKETSIEKSEETIKKKKKKKEKEKDTESGPPKKWREAKSPEGFSYYWHAETGESVWNAPAEGYIPLEKLKKSSKPKNEQTPSNKTKPSNSVQPLLSNQSFGPSPNMDPFGNWEDVPSRNEVQDVDLQLPTLKEPEYSTPDLVFSKPQVKFQEKLVTLSAGTAAASDPVPFKKRKSGVAEFHKKNARKRVDD